MVVNMRPHPLWPGADYSNRSVTPIGLSEDMAIRTCIADLPPRQRCLWLSIPPVVGPHGVGPGNRHRADHREMMHLFGERRKVLTDHDIVSRRLNRFDWALRFGSRFGVKRIEVAHPAV